MSQRLLHKRLFLWAVARILIPPGCLPPIVGDCGKPTPLLGAADVQVGHDLAICFLDPCTYLSIGRFFRLPSGLRIVVINFDHNSKKAIRHGCDRYGVRIPYIWDALTKKIPATNAGTKFQNKEKPAACELLTAGVGCDVNKWISLASLLYYIIL